VVQVSNQLYFAQVVLLGGGALLLLRRSPLILRLQVVIWMIGVTVVALRFGLNEQLNFYSNDQRYYVDIVKQISLSNVVLDVDWLLSYSKIPYTLPAGILAAMGIAPSLALKAISLFSLLLLTRLVLASFLPQTLRTTLITVFFTACGGIGLFCSILALRETMMMLFATYFLVSKVPATRVIALVMLLLLRPHLAAALLVGALFVQIWESMRSRRRESTGSIALLTVLSVVGGYLLFSAGLWWQYRLVGVVGHQWGTAVVTRAASNFVGLQFLTARSEAVEFSLASLLALRILLSETILIPLGFMLALLLRPAATTTIGRNALVSLAMYVGLVTNTEFNSFRQNIPFMAVMGIVILNAWMPSKSQMGNTPTTKTFAT
jgi:hypothetical protein